MESLKIKIDKNLNKTYDLWITDGESGSSLVKKNINTITKVADLIIELLNVGENDRKK